jgi:RNA polymerase sigma-70 factor (ECF subfamily)
MGVITERSESRTVFEAFVAADRARLVAAVLLVTGNRSDAEDSVAEALASAWVRLEQGEDFGSLRAWCLTVALNHARGRHRRRYSAERAYRLLIGGLRDVIGPATGDAIDLGRAVTQLPERQREAVVLRYWADLSVVETAAAMGIADGTVKALLHQARGRLAALLADHQPTVSQSAQRIGDDFRRTI